jgi:hypothetical protein
MRHRLYTNLHTLRITNLIKIPELVRATHIKLLSFGTKGEQRQTCRRM